MEISFKQWLNIDESLALKGDYKGSFFQRLVAAAYQIAPVKDEATIPLYRDLWNKINRQNQFLRHDYEFVPDSGDHYKSMKQLTRDINQQRAGGQRRAKMFVYAEPPGPEQDKNQSGHPVLSNDENVVVRGVHDAIAHIAGQHPFSARGEYAAYNRHLKTMCNLEQVKGGQCQAAKILFTEIVGQTSFYYIYGDFPPQKAVVLNDFDHYRVGLLSQGSSLNQFFTLQGKELVPVQEANWQQFFSTPIGQEFQRQDKVSRFAKLSRLPNQDQSQRITA